MHPFLFLGLVLACDDISLSLDEEDDWVKFMVAINGCGVLHCPKPVSTVGLLFSRLGISSVNALVLINILQILGLQSFLSGEDFHALRHTKSIKSPI